MACGFLYYDKVCLCTISKANEFWLVTIQNKHKSVQSKNKFLEYTLYEFKILQVSLCMMYLCVKFQRLWFARYANTHRSGQSKNNSSWDAHTINLRFCRFLCIMIKFQRLTSYWLARYSKLHKSGQSKKLVLEYNQLKNFVSFFLWY